MPVESVFEFLPGGGSIRAPSGRKSRPTGNDYYVEGQVSIGGQALQMNSVGSAQLMAGQTLTTGNGRAEILLTPGALLRVAEHSSLTMISPDLANIEVRVDTGRAMAEVGDIFKDNNIRFDENGTVTRLLKKGLYDFDLGRAQVRVFDGEAVSRH